MSIVGRGWFLVAAVALLAADDPDVILKQAQSDLAAGRYSSAVRAASHAADLFRQTGDLRNVARSLTNAGLGQMYSGDYAPALTNFREAGRIARQIHNLDYEVTSLNNIGTVFSFTGRYAEAADQYRQAMSRVDTAPDEKSLASRRQLTIANTAVLYQTLGQNDRALALYNDLLQHGQALPPPEQAQVLANIGVLRRRLGDPEKALATYREAQQIYQKAGHRDGEIAILNNIGILQATDLRDFPAATAIFTRALHLAEQSGDRPLIVQARLHRGETYYRAGQWNKSKSDFDAALAAALATAQQEEQWKAEYGLARVAIHNRNFAAANSLLRSAVKRIESMRASLGNLSLRSAFLADKRDVYDLLVENTSNLEEVFQYMEQSRARGLRDRAAGASPHSVPEDTAILEYWMGSSTAAVLWVTADAKGIKRWPLTGAERDAIAGLRLILADPKRSDWATSTRTLAPNLLKGVAPLNDPRIRRLIVVPDGPLAQIPFEALPFGSGLLIDRFTVSYSPAAALAVSRPRPKPTRWPWQRSLEAFADPAPGGAAATDLVHPPDWTRLPGARREVQMIASALGGRAALYEGPAALKSIVRQNQHAPVLHFATHAFADSENPDLSYILLAPADPSQRFDYLFLKEVADLPLTGVDLLTLSACETAVGTSVPGEGPANFSRAFLASGVPAVVTSLWSVGDQSSAEFMARFYSRLGAGASTADALRGAKLEFAHSTTASHPAYWAAFVLHGDGVSSLPRVIRVSWIAAAVLFLVVLIAAIRSRVRKA